MANELGQPLVGQKHNVLENINEIFFYVCDLNACFLIGQTDVHFFFTSSVCHVNNDNFDFDVQWMLISLCLVKVLSSHTKKEVSHTALWLL